MPEVSCASCHCRFNIDDGFGWGGLGLCLTQTGKEEDREQSELEEEKRRCEYERQKRKQQEIKEQQDEKERLKLMGELTKYFFQFKSTSTIACKEAIASIDFESMKRLERMVAAEMKAREGVVARQALSLAGTVIGALSCLPAFWVSPNAIMIVFVVVAVAGLYGGGITFIILLIKKMLVKFNVMTVNSNHPITDSLKRIYWEKK